MIKAEKTLKLSVEKPQYITVNDITSTHRWIPGLDIAGGSGNWI